VLEENSFIKREWRECNKLLHDRVMVSVFSVKIFWYPIYKTFVQDLSLPTRYSFAYTTGGV